ncbi:diacylglycerol/lipid kinase family protein [Halpernia sp.]|uniref:diacylglycerol/lipid kinase family protein n=1 Tax=Halpernia sp. TaxID=2782209 RepID=UPI003A95BA02
MQKVAFIINPFSAKKNYQVFLDHLKSKVENPLVYISVSVAGTEKFIDENFNSTDIFIAIGGDGTISSVAKKLLNTGKILGGFPAGSGNGFSREVNFNKNIDELLDKIQKNNFKEIDTFTINNLLSINVSGTGFDAEVAKKFEETSRGFKNYIKVTLKTFFKYKPVEMKFQEKYSKYDGKYLMINLANTRQFGNNAFISPNSDLCDGLVEVALVKKFPIYYAPIFAYEMFSGKLKENNFVKYISVSEIKFSVNTKIWHIDGDYKEIFSPIEVHVNPKSLRILV